MGTLLPPKLGILGVTAAGKHILHTTQATARLMMNKRKSLPVFERQYWFLSGLLQTKRLICGHCATTAEQFKTTGKYRGLILP